jgi:hypothetical protein
VGTATKRSKKKKKSKGLPHIRKPIINIWCHKYELTGGVDKILNFCPKQPVILAIHVNTKGNKILMPCKTTNI